MTLGYLDPIAFHLFTKPVYWYGIIIATTVFFAYYLADREATKRGLKKDTMLDLLLIALPIAFIFARAYYVIFRWEFYKGDFASMIAIWDGGIAIYGGLIGGFVVLYFFARRNFIIENMYIDGAYRQPTFLYESLWCLIALVILLLIRNKLAQSEVFAAYLILYGVERFIVEGMRTDSLYLGSLRVSQVLSLVFVVGSLLYLIVLNTKYKDKKILYRES